MKESLLAGGLSAVARVVQVHMSYANNATTIAAGNLARKRSYMS